jgi:hypothetical protein
VGALVALPWWVVNLRPAAAKALRSSGFVRHSLGPKGSLEAVLNWLYVFYQTMWGPALTLLVGAIAVTALVQWRRKRLQWTAAQGRAIALCLVAAGPTLLLSTMATNQNPRLIAPMLVPVAIAVALVASAAGWFRSRWGVLVGLGLMAVQLGLIVAPSPGAVQYKTADAAAETLLWGNPSTVLRREEQRDWAQLRSLVQAKGIQAPALVYLGGGSGLTAPAIAAPWVAANEPITVRWLWRYEYGTPDWSKLLAEVRASHVVLTGLEVSGSVGNKDAADNQYNRELMQRMATLPDFDGPLELRLGRFDQARFQVFVRRQGSQPEGEPKLPLLDLF